MIMVTIGWNIIVYVLVLICTFIFAITRDNSPGWLGFSRDWAIMLWIVFALLFTAIWGGIFWW